MSTLSRSVGNFNRSMVRGFKSEASKNSRPSFVSYARPKSAPFKNFEQGSSSGKEREQTVFEQTPAEFVKHRQTMKDRFPDGWNPPRKLSREAMDGLRTLHAHNPETFTTPVLAERFRISPEAVRRILKSKWLPNKEEKGKLLQKERRRKEENIAKRIAREKADKWAQFDSREEKQDEHRERDDGFTLV
ncbi:hypothetical protein DFH11DRAFT_286794 [Phellopilus nigrolimitatus]|nr:hypothetical protein DFH11DRAFT_286794 [Phellopilus nigrolimitatus]